MVVSPPLFLALADRLAKDWEDEDCTRSAVSRAYYAAFLRARSLAEKYGWRYDRNARKNEHQQVRTFLEQKVPGAERAAVQLRSLHEYRIAADYHVPYDEEDPDKLARDVPHALLQAKSIIQAIDDIP